jgi:hypothetical protein
MTNSQNTNAENANTPAKKLSELLKTPEESRDQAWENAFFMSLSQCQLKLLFDEPKYGPEGWPYLLTQTIEADEVTGGETKSNEAIASDEKNNETGPHEDFYKLVGWLSERGIGLVVNPHKQYPDYVFTYGMLWHYRETGLFYRQIDESKKSGQFELETKNLKNFGPPTEKYFPLYARKILRDFFQQQTAPSPRILVWSTDGFNFELGLSLESLGNPPEHEHKGILEAISWFMPPHYQMALVSEKGLPEFSPL